MLAMALQYHLEIDDIMANKYLKLWKFKLDNNDWEIISDLVHVLKASLFHVEFIRQQCSDDLE
jgi:hypothetical protein